MAVFRQMPAVPLKLKKIDGHWKLDLYSSFANPADLKKINRVHGGVANYIGDVATEIAAGKYESVDQVRQELKRRREALRK